jgi:hypothetical protein
MMTMILMSQRSGVVETNRTTMHIK